MLSVAACKATRAALRIAKRGGTALPGKAAMAVQKNILEVVSDGMEIVVVTGTNGKTTTCRMIEHALTSEKEIKALWNDNIKCLGLKYDKASGQYVLASGLEMPEDAQ